MGEEEKVPAIPAPWKLTGAGYILLYRFPERFCRREGVIPHHLAHEFRGGFGTVMYVDYHSSDAGPYQELLFIPGLFEAAGRRYRSITRIYVSTRESVEGGKANWGIPKELASFEKTTGSAGAETIRVHVEGSLVAELSFRSCRLDVPVTTACVPSGLRTLAHPKDGRTLLTTIESKGTVSPARLTGCRTNSALFPPIEEIRPLCTVRVPRFSMLFPRARIV
jgi:hypothetical protein